jgi:hypothetical protein
MLEPYVAGVVGDRPGSGHGANRRRLLPCRVPVRPPEAGQQLRESASREASVEAIERYS